MTPFFKVFLIPFIIVTVVCFIGGEIYLHKQQTNQKETVHGKTNASSVTDDTTTFLPRTSTSSDSSLFSTTTGSLAVPPKTPDTSGWKTYTINDYGLTLRYPNTLTILDSPTLASDQIEIESAEAGGVLTDYLAISPECDPTWDPDKLGVDFYGIVASTTIEDVDDIQTTFYDYLPEPRGWSFYAWVSTTSNNPAPNYDSCGIQLLSSSQNTTTDMAIISTMKFLNGFDYLKQHLYSGDKDYLASHK